MIAFAVKLFAKTLRKERMLENNLHWHLDYTLRKNSSTIIDKRVVFNMNVIRKSVLSILKNIEFKKKYSKKTKLPILMITLLTV